MPRVSGWTFEGTAKECVCFYQGTTTRLGVASLPRHERTPKKAKGHRKVVRISSATTLVNVTKKHGRIDTATAKGEKGKQTSDDKVGKDEALVALHKNCVYFQIHDGMKDQTTFDDNTYDAAESGEKDFWNDESNHEDGADVVPRPPLANPRKKAKVWETRARQIWLKTLKATICEKLP